MIRRCFLVVCAIGEATFLERGKAEDYAARMHGYIVHMFGEDHRVETIEEVNHAKTVSELGGPSSESAEPVRGKPVVHGEA